MTYKEAYEELQKNTQELEQSESDRRQAEQILKYFECAVTASSDAIGISSPEGEHWYQNKAFDHLFGDIGIDPPVSLYVDEGTGREVFQSIMAGYSWDGEVRMYGSDRKILYIMLRAYPVTDEYGEISALVGVHTDITARKHAEEFLAKTNLQLEEKVKERTTEIEDKNIALRVLLDKRKDDNKKLAETIMSNVKELLTPNINRLKASKLDSKQQTLLSILELNLNEITSPLMSSLPSSHMNLTPTEIQVANYIKHGASSKEIASSLGLSRRTIDVHRYNIRQKLGISGTGTNLRSYILSHL